RFAAGAHGKDLRGPSADAVGVRHDKPALVLGRRLQIEKAAGEAVWRHVLEGILVDPLVPDPQEWQALLPGLLAFLAIGDRHDGVAVVVPIDPPLQSKR